MVVGDARHPLITFLIVENPSHTGGVGGIEPTVPGVLRPVTAPQVLLAIIRPVFIDMVNKLPWLSVHDDSVEPYKPLLIIEVIAAYQISVFISIPDVILDDGQVFRVKKKRERAKV